MAFNVSGDQLHPAVEVPLSMFGGLVTEMAAPDLPEGVSPDNYDVTYAPGSVRSRPCLAKQLSPPMPATPTVTYAKSYVDPTGVIRNLYLDSNGQFYYELLSAPGIVVPLFTTTPHTYAKSVTAFGREYIAINDTLHGQEVPLQYDGTNVDRVTQDGPGAPPVCTPHVLHKTSLTSLTRLNNVVTGIAGGPTGLQVGYRVKIYNVAAAQVGGGMVSIVIKNEDLPGEATVTTTTAHGLKPGNLVNLTGITSPTVATIATSGREGQVVTLTTSAPHGLQIGAAITVVVAGDATFNGTYIVQGVPDPTTVTYIQGETTNVGNAGVGTIALNWPLPQAGESTDFTVISAPDATTFTIELSYANGTWTSGQVNFAWNGSFFVQSTPTANTFTYQEYGPDAGPSGTGTINPDGQLSPGVHQCQVMFLTRQGAITAPSPPVSFIANGGQYVTVSAIPIGPANVVARILAFTGAGGAYFFYIPTPAQVNGQVVSTATQINDNTTQTVLIDFSDNTLFDSLGINIPGNDLPAQIVIDGALGFGFYASRLLTWGQRNRIPPAGGGGGLVNMGFDGGFQSPNFHSQPTGWTVGTGGTIVSGRFNGFAWQISSGGSISQSMYQDYLGDAIAAPNTQYFIRVWLQGGGSFTATMSSISLGYTATATVPAASTSGGWFEATFSAKTPATIPTDFTLTISGAAVLVDDMSIIFSESPYLDTIIHASYVNNPEGFDGVSGVFGPTDDTRKIMDFGIIRRNLYLVTQDPTGRLHSTSDNGVTEPAGWSIDEIAANCGMLSAFSLTKSQADDSSAGGGEEWIAWASLTGARIFGGDQPYKISQEIQPDWDAIHLASQLTIWGLNDPVTRRMYFGVPLCPGTAPTVIYVLDYRGLETPYDIAMAQPVRVAFSGKLIATDKARKWTRWRLPMNGAVLMYRPAPVCS